MCIRDRIHASALPGDGRGDLEPQTTTFKESSLSKKGSTPASIFFKPVFKILSCTEWEFNDTKPIRKIKTTLLIKINSFFILIILAVLVIFL